MRLEQLPGVSHTLIVSKEILKQWSESVMELKPKILALDIGKFKTLASLKFDPDAFLRPPA
jgi:hypothetical protein